ncbi:peptide chain release factor-like protein [Aliikangiella coralliicola]|uniref:peptide chain release factor-like protein n=1 Tax=Aliikangiella coralliicola TaxID=2592383 RepID=UPI001AF01454
MSETLYPSDIQFETCRASGPGGQHVNKTNSAVRATHGATGISVKVQSQRSQHANKRLARTLIQHKLDCQEREKLSAQRNSQNQSHWRVERGNPIKVFKGEKFLDITVR